MLFMRVFVLGRVLVFVLVFVLVPVFVAMFVTVAVLVRPVRMTMTVFVVSLSCRLWWRSIRGLAIHQHRYLGGLNSTSVDPLDVQLCSQIQCPYRCL
jgi:hypothetical protein